eukprot:jgi/Ulvmu1/1560/UM110_0023.1
MCQYYAALFALLFAHFGLTCAAGTDAGAELSIGDAVSVSTAAQLQEALRSGIDHIVITEHITVDDGQWTTDANCGGIVLDDPDPNSPSRHTGTKTIRGRCRAPPAASSGNPPLDPPPEQGQCVVVLSSGSPLRMAIAGAVWLSKLYLVQPPPPKQPAVDDAPAALMCVSASFSSPADGIYLTHMTFVGDSQRKVVLSVAPDWRVYLGSSIFTNFAYDHTAVLSLAGGVRAVVHDTYFRYSVDSKRDLGARVADVATLQSKRPHSARSGAVAWFQHSFRRENTEDVPITLTLEDSTCRVFSTGKHTPMRLWNSDTRTYSRPVHVEERAAAPRRAGQHALHADAKPFDEAEADASALPRPGDAVLRQLVAEQAARTGLPAPRFLKLPAASELVVTDLNEETVAWHRWVRLLTCVLLVLVGVAVHRILRRAWRFARRSERPAAAGKGRSEEARREEVAPLLHSEGNPWQQAAACTCAERGSLCVHDRTRAGWVNQGGSKGVQAWLHRPSVFHHHPRRFGLRRIGLRCPPTQTPGCMITINTRSMLRRFRAAFHSMSLSSCKQIRTRTGRGCTSDAAQAHMQGMTISRCCSRLHRSRRPLRNHEWVRGI